MATEEANVPSEKTENEVTGNEKLRGKVVRFFRVRGFGFIQPANAEDEEVKVRWENVVTDDPYPYIKPGTEIEYVTGEGKGGKLEAKEVTLAGGAKIPISTKPTDDCELNTEDIYQGIVDSFWGWKGFGFLKPDEDFTWKDITTDGSLYFSKVGIFSPTPIKSGYGFKMWKGQRVRFKVYKDSKMLGAYEIKCLDGTPIEQVLIEEGQKKDEDEQRKRKLDEIYDNIAKKVKTDSGAYAETVDERKIDEMKKVYVGRVMMWKEKQKHGRIMPTPKFKYKGITPMRGLFVRADDIICTSEEVGLEKGSRVKFKIYMNSRGMGAYDITDVDDMPIKYQPVNKVESANDVPKIAAAEEQNKEEA